MKKRSIILSLILGIIIGVFNSNAQDNITENKDITALINKKRQYNKHNGTGYRIQLYNGLETRAKSLEKRFQIKYPNIQTMLKYEEPEWKVQVGNYKTRLEADRSLNEIREQFNGAIVIPL
ncbi:SPOR domain-containing protein [Tenacibaculum bernardetii]|uniref:SPOR domain-containing protein n=1 Tax=Tenacibaculum bernardetii TaxID=3021375 RepID=UPI0023B1D644|nr:SPOR domain-containing protein [Tenacibaculum bernardetii]